MYARREAGYIGGKVLMMELLSKRKRGKPKKWFMYVVRENMLATNMTKGEAEEMNR